MSAEVAPIVKLKRFLHYGNVSGVYRPGSRWDLKYYTPDIVEPIRSALRELETETIIETIRKVHDQKTSPFPELISFVLAECLREPRLKKDGLALAESVCSSPEAFISLFVFGFKLLPQIGTGRSIRRFIASWYLNKTDLQLAAAVTKNSSFRGWTHKDLIFLARVKSNEPGKKAILKYLSHDLKAARAEFGQTREAAEVLAYLQSIDFFRYSTIEDEAVEMIEHHMLSVENLPCRFLKEKRIWIALLRHLPLQGVLRHFQLMSRSGMFRIGGQWDTEFLEAIADALSKISSFKSGLHPIEPYVELLSYKFLPTFKLNNHGGTQLILPGAKKPPAISSKVVNAFEELIENLSNNLKPSGFKFMISVDPTGLPKRKCLHMRFADAHHAAAILLSSFLKAEENLTILTPAGRGKFQQLNAGKTQTVDCLVDELVQSSKSTGPLPAAYWSQPQCSSSSVFDWAVTNGHEVDVFVIIDVCIYSNKCLENFLTYKRKKNPSAKLILCSLCAPLIDESNINEKDVLAINGFDRRVGHIITSFLANSF